MIQASLKNLELANYRIIFDKNSFIEINLFC